MTKSKNSHIIEKQKSESIGVVFEAARKKRKLTIKDVSNSLKVKELEIRNLENDNIRDMQPIYINGLIKSYGKLLKIDDQIIYHNTKNIFNQNIKNSTIGRISKSNKNYKANNKLIIYSIVILIFLYMIIHHETKFIDLSTHKIIDSNF